MEDTELAAMRRFRQSGRDVDLLALQREWKQSNAAPAAKLVRRSKPKGEEKSVREAKTSLAMDHSTTPTATAAPKKKISLFRQRVMEKKRREALEAQPQPDRSADTSMEHRVTADVRATGFPAVETVPREILLQFADDSRQQQPRAQVTPMLPSTDNRFSGDAPAVSLEEELAQVRRDVAQSNIDAIEAMSTSEIEREQLELAELLGPELVAQIKRRYEENPSMSVPPASQIRSQREEKHGRKEEGPPINERADDQNTTYTVEQKNEWMRTVPRDSDVQHFLGTLPPSKAERLTELLYAKFRVDFSGAFVPLSRAVETHEGLHHHGKDPLRAGYTLEEVMMLSRSTVAQQRTVFLRVLCGVLRRARTHSFSFPPLQELFRAEDIDAMGPDLAEAYSGVSVSPAAFSSMVVARLVTAGQLPLVLRLALDDHNTSVLQWATAAIHALLVCPERVVGFLEERGNVHAESGCVWYTREQHEQALAIVSLHEQGHAASTRKEGGQQEEAQSLTMAEDQKACAKDVLLGLVRMGLLHRVRYVLEVVKPANPLPLLEIVLAVTLHSHAGAMAVFRTERLCDTLAAYVVDALSSSSSSSSSSSDASAGEGETVLRDVVAGGLTVLAALCRYSHEYAAYFLTSGATNAFKAAVLACCEAKLTSPLLLARANAALYLWQVFLTFGLDDALYADVFPTVWAALGGLRARFTRPKLVEAKEEEEEGKEEKVAWAGAQHGAVLMFVSKAFDVAGEACVLVGRRQGMLSFQLVTSVVEPVLHWLPVLALATGMDAAGEVARCCALAALLRCAGRYLDAAAALKLEGGREAARTLHLALCPERNQLQEVKRQEMVLWEHLLGFVGQAQESVARPQRHHPTPFTCLHGAMDCGAALAVRDARRGACAALCAALGSVLKWLPHADTTRRWSQVGLVDDIARVANVVAEEEDDVWACSQSTRWLAFHSAWLLHLLVMPAPVKTTTSSVGGKKEDGDEKEDSEQAQKDASWLEELRVRFLVMAYTVAWVAIPRLVALSDRAQTTGKLLSSVVFARRYLEWLFPGRDDDVSKAVLAGKLVVCRTFLSQTHVHGNVVCLQDYRETASAPLRANTLETVVDRDGWVWMLLPLRYGALLEGVPSSKHASWLADFLQLVALLCVEPCARTGTAALVDMVGSEDRRAVLLRGVMEVFLAGEGGLFLEEHVQSALERVLAGVLGADDANEEEGKGVCVLSAAAVALDSAQCRMYFGGLYPFAKDFTERFKSDSFGSRAFLRCQSMLLQTSVPSTVRELVWYEAGRVLLAEGAELPCDSVPSVYLAPADAARRLVKLYLAQMERFAASGLRVSDALDNPFYCILVHHVASFVLGVNGDQQGVSGRVLMLQFVAQREREYLIQDLQRYACDRLHLDPSDIAHRLRLSDE